jgi:hypothetical protein
MFDLIDGGIPATFTDGPKQGHVGVVTDTGDGPPKALHFINNTLTYIRKGRAKVEVLDTMTGRPRKAKGVAYSVDPKCAFMLEVRREVKATEVERTAGRIETT